MSAPDLIVATGAPVALPAMDERPRLLRRLLHDRSAVVGLVIAGLFLVGTVGAPWLSPDDPTATDFANRFASSSADHPLGTDNLGRDTLSRILHGGRLSLAMAASATLGVTLLGVALGLLAGTAGRAVETVIMRLVDVLLALPTLILALVVVGLLGQGLRNLVITIIFVQWPRYARLVWGMTLSIREREFIDAAKASGSSRIRIVLRHLAPNLIGPVVVLSTLEMGRTLLAVSGLSFLGFGITPPTPEWGAMLSEARAYLDRAAQLLIYPGLAISLMVLAFNLAGDGLRDLLDPRSADRAPGRGERLRRRRALEAAGELAPGGAIVEPDPVAPG